MDITSLTCPNCGASLSVKASDRNIVCEYCESRFVIGDFAENIFDNTDEAEKVRQLIEPLTKLETARAQLMFVEKRWAETAQQRKYESLLDKKWAPFAFGGIILVISLLITSKTNTDVFSSAMETVADIAFSVFTFIVASFLFKPLYKLVSWDDNQLADERETLKNTIKRINELNDFSILPENYRTKAGAIAIHNEMVKDPRLSIEQAVKEIESKKPEKAAVNPYKAPDIKTDGEIIGEVAKDILKNMLK